MFESQALSFQNKDKVVSSREKEQKRLERLKRKERKVNEKMRKKNEDARLNRRKERLKLNLALIQNDQRPLSSSCDEPDDLSIRKGPHSVRILR